MPDPKLIAPYGELDIARIRDLRLALDDAIGQPGDGLVVDLSDVSFIDSSGVGALVEAHGRMRRQQRGLAIVAPRGTASALTLTLTGLRSRLSVFETRCEALEAL
jgi:anti-anti-sigma factor